jgi:hypothetical protein
LNLLNNILNFKIMELAVVNLGDLNLVELSCQEIEQIDGGWPGIGWWMDVAFGYGGYSGNAVQESIGRTYAS